MYGKYMRDIIILDFYVESDKVVRFRHRDGKVVFVDLLAGVGGYSRSVDTCQQHMRKMVKRKDVKLADLESLEVTAGRQTGSHCLMFFEDAIKLLSRMDVCEVNNALLAHYERTKDSVDSMVRAVHTPPPSSCIPRVEYIVRDAINKHFDGFIHNKVMAGGAHGHDRRIDHRLLIGNTILAVETDENAHDNYRHEDEQRRYLDFHLSFPHKFVFIRFNPDNNMEKAGSATSVEHKIKILVETITYQMHRIQRGHNVSKLEVVWLFY